MAAQIFKQSSLQTTHGLAILVLDKQIGCMSGWLGLIVSKSRKMKQAKLFLEGYEYFSHQGSRLCERQIHEFQIEQFSESRVAISNLLPDSGVNGGALWIRQKGYAGVVGLQVGISGRTTKFLRLSSFLFH